MLFNPAAPGLTCTYLTSEVGDRLNAYERAKERTVRVQTGGGTENRADEEPSVTGRRPELTLVVRTRP